MSERHIRHKRIRAKISGTEKLPRVSIFRSNANLYLTAVDDVSGKTLASASTLKLKEAEIADDLSKKLQAKKIKKIVFDRSGYRYLGKVKKIAEDLRKSGLEF